MRHSGKETAFHFWDIKISTSNSIIFTHPYHHSIRILPFDRGLSWNRHHSKKRSHWLEEYLEGLFCILLDWKVRKGASRTLHCHHECTRQVSTLKCLDASRSVRCRPLRHDISQTILRWSSCLLVPFISLPFSLTSTSTSTLVTSS